MAKTAWKKFPFPDPAFAYPGSSLRKHWARLHRGDCEPFPAAEAAQDAWRAYHAGAFAGAVAIGLTGGPSGINAANKAAMIHANHLEDDPALRLRLFEEVAGRCVALQERAPDDPNAWYFHAYALGRYSQGISVAKALAQGLGGKIRHSLERALELQPRHADAHIALGTWHAEVTDKVGSLVGGLTYGARKEASEQHFRAALALNPDSAVARTEYADGLLMLFGRSRRQEAEQLYADALSCTAADAMERLDIEQARQQVD